MLEIKTIRINIGYPDDFDQEVNAAIADGWELVRREVIPAHSADQVTYLYAELERDVEEPEEEDEDDDDTARWLITRNPAAPYRCSSCGHRSTTVMNNCPQCRKVMEVMV